MKTKNAPAREKSAKKAAVTTVAKNEPIIMASESEMAVNTEKKGSGFKPMNMVILTGNLGVDPTVQETKSGRKKAYFTMATNNTYTNKAGAQIEETMWHSLVAWGKLAEKIEGAIKKGDKISVTGRIHNRSYTDSNGASRLFTEIVLRSLEIIQPGQVA